MFVLALGDFSLIVGFVVIFMPLLITELSRPRDGFFGAIIFALGLLLVNSRDLFDLTSILMIILGAVLTGKLGLEVWQSRWLQLSDEERLRLKSRERWLTAFKQLGATIAEFGKASLEVFNFKSKPVSKGKKWVRPEKDTVPGYPDQLETNSQNTIDKSQKTLQNLSEETTRQ